MTNGTKSRQMSERQLLAKLARNAERLAAVDALYDERLTLIRAARARPKPVRYEDIAEATDLSLAGVFKVLRVAARNGR